MAAPNLVAVTMYLHMDVYRPVEKKATALGITAGRFLAAFVEKSVRLATGGNTPTFKVSVGTPDGGYATSYSVLADDALNTLIMWLNGGTPFETIADRFHVPATAVKRWARDLARDGLTRKAEKPSKRKYVRLEEHQFPEFVRMVVAGDHPKEIAERFGISVSSVANWRTRLDAQIITARNAATSGEDCGWCGEPATGIAYATDEHTYPSPSCGDCGYDFAGYVPADEAPLREPVPAP